MDDTNISQMRETAAAKLRRALAELEADEELTAFVEGTGFQSRVFAFQWNDETLSIDLRLPYARVLSSEETQRQDALELGVALRMAILLLSAPESGEARISVIADEDGVDYAVFEASGAEADVGEGWETLVARLERACPAAEAGNIAVFWP
jgi:hypothetical protein